MRQLIQPEHFFRTYREKDERILIGLHSGTSTDGVGAVVLAVSGSGESAKARYIAHVNYEYSDDVRERLVDISERSRATVDKVCQANVLLGNLFADAAFAVASKAGISMSDVDGIASSGQIIYHVRREQLEDEVWIGDDVIPSGLDLGEPTAIAERTGVSTVADLRIRDMVLGGEGNPLVTYGDWVLFRHHEKNRAVLNLGGIANPTILPAGGSLESVMAFDTGPANMLIDALMAHYSGGRTPYDKDGEFAATGQVHDGLLAELMEYPFIKRKPPKAAGRELFGLRFFTLAIERGKHYNLSEADMVATATALTAASIHKNLEMFVFPTVRLDEILLCGGGAYNRTVVRELQKRLPGVSISKTDVAGIPVEAREASCIAVIGNESFLGSQGNVPSATGSSRPAVMGKLVFGYSLK